jgi:Mg-chelatase subunit ChlD
MSYWNILLVDSSASMSSNSEAVNKGIVDLFTVQKDNTDRFTFLTFNTEVNLIIDANFNEIMPEDITSAIKNNGLTALYDAVGYVYEMIIPVDSNKPENILLSVITDGYENSSKKYTLTSLRNLRKIVDKNCNLNVTFISENKNVLDANSAIISHANESCEVNGDYMKALRTVSRGMSNARNSNENREYSIEENERSSSREPLLKRQVSNDKKKRPRLF